MRRSLRQLLRQQQREDRTLAGLALDPDFAAHELGEFAADGQAQTGAAIKKQWVVDGARLARHLLCRRESQFIGLTLNKIVETVTSVESGSEGGPADGYSCRPAVFVLRPADVHDHGLARRLQVFEDVPNAFEVMGRNVVANVFIG